MRKVLIAAAAVALLAGQAYAAKSSGAYAGLGVGGTAYADDDLVRDIHIIDGTPNYNLDDDDVGAVLFGGYQFNKIIGVEGSLVDYGEFTSTVYSQRMRAFNISANAGYDLLDGQLRPFGLLGLGIVDVDVTKNTALVSAAEGSTMSAHLGFGVDYQPTPFKGAGFRAAYQGNSYIVSLRNIFGYETDYAQVVGIFYIGGFYQF